MFLREIPSKGNIYYSLVHNVREKGRFVQRTIHYFGRLTDEQVENIRKWIRAFPKSGEKFVPINNWQDVKKLASFLHGETALCHNFWRSSGFQDIFFYQNVFNLLYARTPQLFINIYSQSYSNPDFLNAARIIQIKAPQINSLKDFLTAYDYMNPNSEDPDFARAIEEKGVFLA